MQATTLLAPLLFLVLFACVPAIYAHEISGSAQHANENEWNYFVFAQIWPAGGYISQKKSPPPNIYDIFGNAIPVTAEERANGAHGLMNYFTIHGLWATLSATKWPEFCVNQSLPFDVQHFDSALKQQLKTYWIPSTNRTDDLDIVNFWKYEWTKHGTCSTDLPATANQTAFFEKVMQLHLNMPTYDTLKLQGITPSMKPVSFQSVKTALTIVRSEDQTPVAPAIRCYVSKAFQYALIAEMWYCYDKEFKLMKCPDEMYTDAEKSCTIFHKNPAANEDTLNIIYLPVDYYRSSPSYGLFFGVGIPLGIAIVAVLATIVFLCLRFSRKQYAKYTQLD